jgi:hypothetical protein
MPQERESVQRPFKQRRIGFQFPSLLVQPVAKPKNANMACAGNDTRMV